MGDVESDPDKAVLLALGLRCRRSACQVCEHPDKRHSLEDGIDVHEDDPLIQFVAHDAHLRGAPRKLTYDMLPGSYLDERAINAAKRNDLIRWMKCRGIPRGSNALLEDLRNQVLACYKLEKDDPDSVDLQCPDGRSLVEYLVQARKIISVPPLYNSLLQKHVKSSPEWMTDHLSICCNAPVIDNAVIEAYFKEKHVNDSGRCKVLERGHARFASNFSALVLRASFSVSKVEHLVARCSTAIRLCFDVTRSCETDLSAAFTTRSLLRGGSSCSNEAAEATTVDLQPTLTQL